ncbi:MAG: hypothetical protein ACTS7E_03820 [Arsenophonus sp. NC-CH8-MAG3]
MIKVYFADITLFFTTNKNLPEYTQESVPALFVLSCSSHKKQPADEEALIESIKM